MTFVPAATLSDRSYIGLVLSQFLAAFNDQAIHIVAIFYASDLLHGYAHLEGFDQKTIVSIVTACFISPFFLFSPLAGILADKYSKQKTIVFWKVAEIAITALALAGFLLPHTVGWGWVEPKTLAVISAFMVIAAVFLMGTHSAFFVPAKYGIMPEILHTSVLSRGNGLLEGTSFVSQILGTSFGGFLYYKFKNHENPLAGDEWIIGAVLFALAFVGAGFSMLVAKIPAAAPDRRLTLNPLVPLTRNFGELARSRPLVLAVIGIAFFTFMTIFVRQTLLYQGESTKELNNARMRLTRYSVAANQTSDTAPAPATSSANQATTAAVSATKNGDEHGLDELWISILVALVGLGVGGGCALAGKLSGSRLELGLVSAGTTLLVILTAGLSVVAQSSNLEGTGTLWNKLAESVTAQWPTILCLIAIGFAAGLYIVPFYTLLQHRAPKDSKGNMVATSNFMNVTGGLLAIITFFFVTSLLQLLRGNLIPAKIAAESVDPSKLREFVAQLERQQSIPQTLFLAASLITVMIFCLFIWLRPDFPLRTLSYFKYPSRRALGAVNADHLPSYGPLLIVSNAATLEQWLCVVSVIDRTVRFAWQPGGSETGLLAKLTVASGVGTALSRNESQQAEQVFTAAARSFAKGDLFGISTSYETLLSDYARLVERLTSHSSTNSGAEKIKLRLLPVLFTPAITPRKAEDAIHSTAPRVIVGDALPAETPLTEVVKQLAKL